MNLRAFKSLSAASLFQKVWHSPTFMTWASFSSRSLSLVLILPLLLTTLPTPDIALWYLFGTALSIQSIAYAGPYPTFMRTIAFAYGGASAIALKDAKTKEQEKTKHTPPNWHTISQILANTRYMYRYLNLVLLLIVVVSTFFLYRPILRSEQVWEAWCAWGVVIISSFLSLRGSLFTLFLEGVNEVALLRRWDAAFGFVGVCSNFLVLILFGDLLSLVISSQFWLIVNIPRNYFLCRQVKNGVFRSFSHKAEFNSSVFSASWESIWKSTVGTLMSLGTAQVANLVYAQVAQGAMLASYLMGYNLLRQITQFSQAPFYSKIPLLSRLRKQGNIKEFLRIGKRGMLLTYWLLFFCAFTLGISGDFLLEMVGSNAHFPPLLLWVTLSFGVLIERYGALHIQFYSTTNHIIWHIASGVSGAIYLLFLFLALPKADVYAFPIALICSNLGFYSWYTAKHSYQSLNTNFFAFDKKIFLPVLLLSLLMLCWTSFLSFEF